jgi:hypothetical protein
MQTSLARSSSSVSFALGDLTGMIFRRIHTDQESWFCVFRSDETGEHVLYAALREKDFPEVATRLTADETAMFRDRPTDFLVFARAFIASHDSPSFSSRMTSFRSHGADLIEIV